MSVTVSKSDSGHEYRKLSLSHNSADSQASALRLVLTLSPDWEKSDGKIEFIRFKEGITNTVSCPGNLLFPSSLLIVSNQLLKAVKRRPGYTEKEIDDEAVLIRAYGKGTDVLIDRERMMRVFSHCSAIETDLVQEKRNHIRYFANTVLPLSYWLGFRMASCTGLFEVRFVTRMI